MSKKLPSFKNIKPRNPEKFESSPVHILTKNIDLVFPENDPENQRVRDILLFPSDAETKTHFLLAEISKNLQILKKSI